MNIDNLTEGLILKNYKELCEVLGIEPKVSANSRKAQFKILEQYIKYSKEGQKIIIEEVYDTPKDKIDNRHSEENRLKMIELNKARAKSYKEMNITKEEWNKVGVYKITLNNNIYIGSTDVGFKTRFQQHYQGADKQMQHTYNLLHNGGIFEIIESCENMTRQEIRMLESNYIRQYMSDNNWNVINGNKGFTLYEKYKRLKIKECDYDNVIKILNHNGYNIIKGNEVVS